MNKSIFLLIGFFSLTVISCNLNKTTLNVNDGILITNPTIISTDSLSNVIYYKGYIVTDSNKIIYAGEKQPIVKGKYITIDGNDKYVIPGLIDSHVHLASMAGMNPRHKRKNPDLVNTYFEQLPKSFLYFGYTTLIDVNNYAPSKLNQLRKSKLRPDIYACGNQVQVMDDFMMEMEEYTTSQKYSIPFLHDHYNENVHLPDSIDLGLHSPEAIIKNIVEEQNGICVKMLYEDASSGMNVTWQSPSKGILEEIVKEARSYGIRSIMHAPSFGGQSISVESEIDIIAHAMWNWSEDPNKITDTILPPSHSKLLQKISDKEIGYQPTFMAIVGEINTLNENFLNDKMLNHVFPAEYLSWIKSEEGKWLVKRILNRPNYIKRTNPGFYNVVRTKFNSDADMISNVYNVLKTRIKKVTSALAENKANLLFGTDFGVMNMYTVPPGYSGFLEMKHWEEAGVDLETIFIAATSNNAKEFNLDHLYGSIDKDKIANLLILDSNPLKSVEAYNKIDKIILHGESISRERLSALSAD